MKNSNFTEEQKEKIKKRDNYSCQYNKKFGIVELTGVLCSEKLEVHHIRYRYSPRLKDGITVCERCHKFITTNVREIRNRNRPIDRSLLNGNFGFNRINIKRSKENVKTSNL